MSLLEIQHVSRNFDGVLAVDDVSFRSHEGETVSVIGPNGAGKTTLFNLITGLDRPTSGEIFFAGQDMVGLPVDQFARAGLPAPSSMGAYLAT
jgi:branched-chain amino acid transport system ATP-binding protein